MSNLYNSDIMITVRDFEIRKLKREIAISDEENLSLANYIEKMTVAISNINSESTEQHSNNQTLQVIKPIHILYNLMRCINILS